MFSEPNQVLLLSKPNQVVSVRFRSCVPFAGMLHGHVLLVMMYVVARVAGNLISIS